MQYKGYEIQETEMGYIIRTSTGQYITSAASDEEAKEYVDDISSEETSIKQFSTDWYKRFEKYCAKLPGKCYPNGDGKFGTVFEKSLYKFIQSFEKKTNTKVNVTTDYRGGEYYFIVDSVNEN